MAGLSNSEIMRVVNRYIGVEGGYLGDFSYRTHAEFYPEYCDLDIDPYQIDGTTRQRFIQILSGADPRTQARILRGVLERFPPGLGPPTRTAELKAQIEAMASRLEGSAPVPAPSLKTSSATLERSIADAEALIRENGATSGVDRVHTALHSHLIALCSKHGISHAPDATATALFKELRKGHPALRSPGPRSEDVVRVLQSCATILDALGPLRNRASVAHPNETLLQAAEAMLVVNVARTLLHYFDARLS